MKVDQKRDLFDHAGLTLTFLQQLYYVRGKVALSNRNNNNISFSRCFLAGTRIQCHQLQGNNSYGKTHDIQFTDGLF